MTRLIWPTTALAAGVAMGRFPAATCGSSPWSCSDCSPSSSRSRDPGDGALAGFLFGLGFLYGVAAVDRRASTARCLWLRWQRYWPSYRTLRRHRDGEHASAPAAVVVRRELIAGGGAAPMFPSAASRGAALPSVRPTVRSCHWYARRSDRADLRDGAVRRVGGLRSCSASAPGSGPATGDGGIARPSVEW